MLIYWDDLTPECKSRALALGFDQESFDGINAVGLLNEDYFDYEFTEEEIAEFYDDEDVLDESEDY